MTILQERYNALQYKTDKQAQIKSIKGWFNDTKHDEYWWTSNIAIPYI